MAEGRMLKREIANSKKLGKLRRKDKARVMYFMILPHLDIEGRHIANPHLLKGQVMTMLEYSQETIQVGLEALHEVGLIILYTVNGEQYLEYTRFGDFQKLYPSKEAGSKIPGPTLENSGELRRTPGKEKGSKVKRREEKGSKVNYSESFLIFWQKFKGRWDVDKGCYVKLGKFTAFEEWKKLSAEDQQKATAVAHRAGGKFVPDPCRWLKNRMFDDFEIPKTK